MWLEQTPEANLGTTKRAHWLQTGSCVRVHYRWKTEIPDSLLDPHSSWTPGLICWVSLILLSTCGCAPWEPPPGSSRGHQPGCSSYPRPRLRAKGSNILPHLYPTCDALAFLPRLVEQENLIQLEEKGKKQKTKNTSLPPPPPTPPPPHSHLVWVEIPLFHLQVV